VLWKRIPENLIYQDEGIRFRFSPVIEATPLMYKYKDQPWSQIEQWIKPLLIKSGKMDGALKAFTDKLCETLGPRESAEKIFLFVRDKINYFAIENGVWAFRPQPIAKTFSYRLGDCKAKALLLTQMLRYKGIPAWFCLASSISHKSNLDFPCTGNANHAICMVKLGEERYFLDATITTQAFDAIPVSVAGKNILAVALDEQLPEVIKVPELSPADYMMKTNLSLKFSNDTLSGSIEVTQGKGLSAMFRGGLDQIPKKDAIELWYRSLFEQTGKSCLLSEFVFHESDTINNTIAQLKLFGGKIVHDAAHSFLMMDFLPFRLGYFEQIPEGFFYRNTTPLTYEMTVNIEFSDPIPPQQDRNATFAEGQYLMNYSSKISGTILTAKLEVVIPAGEQSGKSREAHNKFIDALNNTLHYAVQIH
jgi:hypothetical protein